MVSARNYTILLFGICGALSVLAGYFACISGAGSTGFDQLIRFSFLPQGQLQSSTGDAVSTSYYYDYSSVDADTLRILEGINSPRNSRKFIVRCCRGWGLCGGSGDRIRGLSFIISLADELHANITIDPSYAFGPPQTCDSNTPYIWLVDTARLPDLNAVFAERNEIQITSNREEPKKGTQFDGWCHSYQCGNLILSFFSRPSKPLMQASSFVDDFLEHWTTGSHVSLHVRTGGSEIRVGRDAVVPAVPWSDGFSSGLPNRILDWAGSLPRDLTCKSSLVLASDSVRFATELSIRMPHGVNMPRCCTVPSHSDRSSINSVQAIQQYVDLLLMARSEHIFSTIGGFSKLASSFVSFSEVNGTKCQDASCLDSFLHSLQSKLGCS
ncbi:hypothetical protein M9435_004862 [Picochlorum sp. BPE23]|nr:hypothetical protein M9435_004862 [Picochlorum sp. BPE23]